MILSIYYTSMVNIIILLICHYDPLYLKNVPINIFADSYF